MNKFAAAPGSLGDLTSGGANYPLPFPAGSEATAVGAVWDKWWGGYVDSPLEHYWEKIIFKIRIIS